MQREDGTLFAPENPFQLCFLHNQHTPYIASGEQGLRDIVEHEIPKEQWAGLFPTRESIPHIACIFSI